MPAGRDPENTSAALQRIHLLKKEALTSQTFSGEMGKLEAKVESLKGERRALRREFQAVEDELRLARGELSKRDVRYSESEEKTRVLEARIQQIEGERTVLLDRQRELGESAELARQLEVELKKSEASNTRITNTLEGVKGELERLHEDKAALKRELRNAAYANQDRRPLVEMDLDDDDEEIHRDSRLVHRLRDDHPKLASILERLLDTLQQTQEERDLALRALEEAGSPGGNGGEAPADGMDPPMESIPAANPPPAPEEGGAHLGGGEKEDGASLQAASEEDTAVMKDGPSRTTRGEGPADLAMEEEKLRGVLAGVKGHNDPPTERLDNPGAGVSRSSSDVTQVIDPRDIGDESLLGLPEHEDKRKMEIAVGPLVYLFDVDEAPARIQLDTIRQVIRSYLSFLKRSPGEALRFPYPSTPETYLRQHSHNVSKLAMFLGMHLGEPDQELLLLGLAGILHDVGLAEIPESIVNKKGPLTETEMRWIREHPTIGSRILEGIEGLEREIPVVVRQHHERVDGTGYPEGLRADRIHKFAKILNLVDGYEAMSSPRVYRDELLPNESMRIIAKPLIIEQAVELPGGLSEEDITRPSPSRAMEQVVLQTPQVYDPALVRAFLLAMSYYPMGSYVRLRGGEVARVVGTNGEEIKKPIIKVILDPDGQVPREPVLIDLSTDESTAVSHAVSGVPYEDLP